MFRRDTARVAHSGLCLFADIKPVDIPIPIIVALENKIGRERKESRRFRRFDFGNIECSCMMIMIKQVVIPVILGYSVLRYRTPSV